MSKGEKNPLLLLRDNELRKIHKRIICESGINQKYLTRNFVVAQIEKCSAPRFYLTPKFAGDFISAYKKGKIRLKSKMKQMMAEDLVGVYNQMRDAYPFAQRQEILEKVVAHPAKSFYLSPTRIMEIVFQYHDRR